MGGGEEAGSAKGLERGVVGLYNMGYDYPYSVYCLFYLCAWWLKLRAATALDRAQVIATWWTSCTARRRSPTRPASHDLFNAVYFEFLNNQRAPYMTYFPSPD